MTDTTYGLVLRFPDQSESFALGFEAGEIYRRMKEEQPAELVACLHTKNTELYIDMAKLHGYHFKVVATDVEGWSDFTFTKAGLRLVVDNSKQ
jgi:hypothetical protein